MFFYVFLKLNLRLELELLLKLKTFYEPLLYHLVKCVCNRTKFLVLNAKSKTFNLEFISYNGNFILLMMQTQRQVRSFTRSGFFRKKVHRSSFAV